MKKSEKCQKILIIRFSSFGDIVQCCSILDDLKQNDLEVHWMTKSNFTEILEASNRVDRVIKFEKKVGLLGLIKMALELRNESYDYVYDAHSNIRSRVVLAILRPFCIGPKLIRRSKERWKRFLLFKLGKKNVFDWPYQGMISYRDPLKKYFKISKTIANQQWNLKNLPDLKNKIIFCPSAAWEMKRWPVEHWNELIKLIPEDIYILGGPADHFCKEFEKIAPERVFNLAGKYTLMESCSIIANAKAVVSGDSGLIHVADLLGVKGISLIGPTAFGFATKDNIKTLEVYLSCRPCTKDGRGKCVQNVYKKCLVEISPKQVALELKSIVG